MRDEVEATLAQAAFGDPDALLEVSSLIDQADFNDAFLGSIVETATTLQAAGVLDRTRLKSELRSSGSLKSVEELTTFVELSQAEIVSRATVLHAAQRLRELADQDKIARCLTAASARLGEQTPIEVCRWIGGQLDSISARQTALWKTAGEVAKIVYKDLKHAIQEGESTGGMPTGFPSLDELTGGFFPGQLWQIAARSFMGKTTVALALASQQSARGHGSYIASYEMESSELLERLYSERTGLELKKFTHRSITQSELQNFVLPASANFDTEPLLLDDRPPSSVHGLQARVKLASQLFPIRLVVVDHLLLFPRDRRMPRHEQLVEITRELKAMAKELNCTILLLNQLNADAEGNEPTDRHISEAKGVKANLDVNILLHRDDNRNEDMLWKITKNRKGTTGELRMKFYGEVQRVEEPGLEDNPNYREEFAHWTES